MTIFAKKVYKAVLTIPLGQVRSYRWVAERAGSPRAARAVGQILKNNPWLFIVPCHRVVKSNGDLGGYVFGRRAKKNLLNQERQIKELVL